MNDDMIIELYNKRDEKAITESETKYGKYCFSIANNILENNTQKRGGGQYKLVYDELKECLFDDTSIDENLMEEELVGYINIFLEGLSVKERIVFVKRYFSMESVESIATQMNLKDNHVRAMLSRTRAKLKKHLKEVYYVDCE